MAQFTSLVGILSRSAIRNWVTNNDEAFKTCSEKTVRLKRLKSQMFLLKCMWSSSDDLMRNTELIMRSPTFDCYLSKSEHSLRQYWDLFWKPRGDTCGVFFSGEENFILLASLRNSWDCKAIALPVFHHLFILMLFQTCLALFSSVEHKSRYSWRTLGTKQL